MQHIFLCAVRNVGYDPALVIIILCPALAIFTRVRKSDIELFRILTLVCRSKKSLIDILFAHV